MKLIAGLAAVVVAGAAAFLMLGSSGARIGGPVAQAATLSSGTPGYRVRMSMQMSSSALATPVTASGGGVVDLRDHASAMSMTMNLNGSRARVEMITMAGTVYMKLPAGVTGSLATSGRQWIKLDIGKLSKVPGLSSLGENPTTSDPSSMLQFLRSASGSVTTVGRQRVDGAQTTRYRTELSLADLAAGLPADERDALQPGLSRLQQALGGGQLPIDVWIDARNRVRRVVMGLELAVPNGPSLQETVTMDLSHYGRQLIPTAPPPYEVTDIGAGLTSQ